MTVDGPQLGRGPSLAERLISPWTVGILILAAWEGGVRLFDVPLFLLPDLGAIAATFVDKAALLASGLATTAAEVAASFMLSVLLGLTLGTLTAKSRPFRRTVFPLLIAAQAVPTLAAAPLFVVWFGFGWLPKILIAVLITFFPVMMGTVEGLHELDPALLDMARTLGLRPLDRLTKVQLPAALPAIFAGLRVASTLVVIGVVVGEFVGSSAGLGYLLLRATGTIDTPLLFAALILLVVLGLLQSWLVITVERLAMPWRHATA